MKDIREIENDIKWNDLKLILSYGTDHKIISLGVFNYSGLKSDKDNLNSTDFVQGSNMIFQRPKKTEEKLLIPINNWESLSKGGTPFNNCILNRKNIELVAECLPGIGLDGFLEFSCAHYTDKEWLSLLDFRTLEELGATYLRNGVPQGTNYSVFCYQYDDSYEMPVEARRENIIYKRFISL